MKLTFNKGSVLMDICADSLHLSLHAVVNYFKKGKDKYWLNTDTKSL